MKSGLVILVLGAITVADLHAEMGDKSRSPIYSPVGKRDPFRQPAVDKNDRGLSTVTPTERYGIEKYQLKAILKGMGPARAMFEDPDGKSFILVEGEHIGRERGVISRILSTDVIITERTFNYLGSENLYERVLSLPQEDEAGQIEVKNGQGGAAVGPPAGAAPVNMVQERGAAPMAAPAAPAPAARAPAAPNVPAPGKTGNVNSPNIK